VRVLVVGPGGREHALVRTLLRSPQAPEVLCAPGNAGIRRDARVLDVPADDPAALARAARQAAVDLVVVGPEAPLVAGLADALAAEGVRCFGPVAAAARLEGSKAFAKEIMEAAGVPTGAHRVVRTVDEGMAAVAGYPAVIKADGLAAGKGVVIAQDEAEARAALVDMLEARRFGDHPVVVEEFLEGDELSLLALCDGRRAVPLAPARDYKRIGDGDTGPNTGGMGCFSPVPEADAIVERVVATVHQPVVDELARRGTPFHGVLYAGLMLAPDGDVKVLEFNTRFGDPEAQVVLPTIASDLSPLLMGAAAGELQPERISVADERRVGVVLASGGYPDTYETGKVIHGLEAAEAMPNVNIFHSGTAAGADVVTAGGRVLTVVGTGNDYATATSRAYAAVDKISFEGMQYRRDIAAKARL